MSKKNKRYQTMRSCNSDDESRVRYCLICFQDVHHKESFLHYVDHESLICGECLRKLEIIHQDLTYKGMLFHVFYKYNDFLESLLFQFKEGKDIALRDVFFHEYVNYIKKRYKGRTIIVAPSSDKKIIERGFYPLEEMLKKVGFKICKCLIKKKDMKQSLLSMEERKKIAMNIGFKEDINISNRCVLVDDVMTSGSTLLSSYYELKKHIVDVEVLVLSIHPLLFDECTILHKYSLFKRFNET